MLATDMIRTCNLKQPPGHPLGEGPIIAPDALAKLIAADKTPDQHWLDWIFFQAGGGEKADKMREAALPQIRDRFIEERANGFSHPDTHEFIEALGRKEAEARWKATEPRFIDLLKVSDQDVVMRLNTFGYFRMWPGMDRVYENVVNAVERFQKLYPLVLKMNKETARENVPPVPSVPEDIKTWDEMNKISDKVERYFASKKAREDIRLSGHPKRTDDLIYDDDYVTVVAPLTWAAAVRYGYQGWAWANRETFDEVLSADGNDFRNEWKKSTERGKAYVYITFNVPVPGWVTRKQGEFEHYELTSLALELDTANLRNLDNPDSLEVYDEENRHVLTIEDVKSMIRAEPTRQDPQDDDLPEFATRGPNVYKTPEEAKAVITHLDAALQAIVEWAKAFNPKTIKQNALTLD